MKKILSLLLPLLVLTGCAALLERSYSVVEPYTDRYWDSGDTLRVENYQDLVNSLLLLVEQRAEEAEIRCYFGEETGAYFTARSACREVQHETTLGSYLLESLTFSTAGGPGYSTLTCRMTYRAGAEDPAALLTLSDSQSLVDLLRMCVREDRRMLTARFFRDTPRQEVEAAMDALWRELCLGEEAAKPAALEGAALSGELPGEEPDQPPEDGEPKEDGEPEMEDAGEAPDQEDAVPAPEDPEAPEDPDAPEDAEGREGLDVPPEEEPPPEEPPPLPPCPWEVRFYPDQEEAEIVEIILSDGAADIPDDLYR